MSGQGRQAKVLSEAQIRAALAVVATMLAASQNRIKAEMGELWTVAHSRVNAVTTLSVTAKEHEVRVLNERADALLTLWLQEPATTVCGIALKLRAWLDHTSPDERHPDTPEPISSERRACSRAAISAASAFAWPN
jgi:hypothetical protein